jgi:hypothetical protein
MSRCKNCAHFKRETDGDNYCLNDSKFVYDETTPKDGLSYHDCEQYAAGFYVGEDFGCVHFKGEEDE